MGCVDRTNEFLQTIRQLEASGQIVPQQPIQAAPPQPHVSQFNSQATAIQNEVQRVQKKIDEFEKMVKRRTFGQNETALDEMTGSIRQDVQHLQSNVQHCEQFLSNAESSWQWSGQQTQSSTHEKETLKFLKSRVMGVTLSFKESLEKRTKNMQKQDDRRNQFHSNFDFSGMQPDGGGDGGFVDLEGGGSAGSGGQAVGRAYATSRANAVQNVQKMIGELGQMFSQMGQMVAHQEEMILRIDQNVADAHENVESGTEQLLQYYNHISSNRGLVMKVFAILIFFVIFFVMFLA